MHIKRKLHYRMKNMIPIIDMHCDTIFKIYVLRCQEEDVGLRRSNLHLGLLRMNIDGYREQVTL